MTDPYKGVLAQAQEKAEQRAFREDSLRVMWNDGFKTGWNRGMVLGILAGFAVAMIGCAVAIAVWA